jgi:hypothetical protein
MSGLGVMLFCRDSRGCFLRVLLGCKQHRELQYSQFFCCCQHFSRVAVNSIGNSWSRDVTCMERWWCRKAPVWVLVSGYLVALVISFDSCNKGSPGGMQRQAGPAEQLRGTGRCVCLCVCVCLCGGGEGVSKVEDLTKRQRASPWLPWCHQPSIVSAGRPADAMLYLVSGWAVMIVLMDDQ